MKTPPSVLPELVTPEDIRYGLERFDPKQAAAYLGIAIDRIYRYAAAKQIGHRRDGARRIRFSQADLDAWRKGRRVEAQEGATVKLQLPRQVAAPRSLLPPIKNPVFRQRGGAK